MSHKSPTRAFREALLHRSRQLRQAATPAEQMLWELLRNRKVAGLKFRRQQVLDRFIADFFCAELKLVIELDGGVHAQRADVDRVRQEVLESGDLHVLRFRNEAVLQNPKRVIQRIVATAARVRAEKAKAKCGP